MRITRDTKTISGRNILLQMNDLKAQGYTTLWAGDGRLCMEAPAVGAPLPEPKANWNALLHALCLAELDPGSVNDFMWMGEESPGVHMYKNRDTRNYAHLTGTETRDEALKALAHAYSVTEKWKDRPVRTAQPLVEEVAGI